VRAVAGRPYLCIFEHDQIASKFKTNMVANIHLLERLSFKGFEMMPAADSEASIPRLQSRLGCLVSI
jgi:hypothetical protein